MMLLSASLCVLVGLFLIQPVYAESSLEAAYKRLRFDQQYPPEMAKYVRSRLDGSNKPIEEVLSELAQDNRAEVRVLVAMLLGELGDTKGGEILWKLSTDDAEVVRITAVGALQRLGAITKVSVKVDGLKDSRAEVRRLIAGVLGRIRDKSAEEALVEALSDSSEMVRMEAARALGTCGTMKRAAPALIAALKDSSVLVRTWAAASLEQFPDPTVAEALKRAMEDSDWHVRARAAQSLAGVIKSEPDNKAQTALFIKSLQADQFALVRDRNADALGIVQDEGAVKTLVDAVVQDDQQARFHAARAIVTSKLHAALPLLREHRNDSNPEVRSKVIEVIGELGSGTDVSLVADALTDPSTRVRMAAVEALKKLRQQAKPDLIFSKLNDTDPHVRTAAARVLGDLGDTSASARLLPLLRDDNGFVRDAAAEALGKLGDRTAVEPLIKLLTGESVGVSTGAVGGLVIGSSNQGLLFELERQTVGERKEGAVKALGVLKAFEAVDPIVVHGLQATDLKLRAISAYALGQIGDVRAVTPLERTVQPFYESAPKLTDTDIIISTGTNAVSDTARQDMEKQVRVRASVAWALGQIGDPKAKETLIKALEDPNSLVRDAAQEALAKIAEREFAPSNTTKSSTVLTNASSSSSR